MKARLKFEYKPVSELVGYKNNARTHSDEQVKQISNSIKQFGFISPVVLHKDNQIMAGHGRIEAAKLLKMQEVPTVNAEHLTDAQKRAFIIADNRLAELAGWDMPLLKDELITLHDEGFDIDDTGFTLDDIDIDMDDGDNTQDDEVPEVPSKPKTKLGDLIELGNHRLLCGDCTDKANVDKLMGGERADMAHNDPPYGMKKENEGVLNDNLNYDDLLAFNKQWIALQFDAMLKDNGAFYCWGIDEPLMDIYSQIIKPLIKTQKATFRNLITWNKGHGQGMLSPDFRSYPPVDEKCLFVMCGVQGFNNNADNYFSGWDSIVKYLDSQKNKARLTIKDCKKIAGHSINSGCHWFDKSQWSMPTKAVYEAWQNYCQSHNIKAFLKSYDKLKQDFYKTRAYFDNTHDNMTNVWSFDRTSHEEREQTGDHVTPKPLALCMRAVKSSCPKGGLVVDTFLGSGSTLIACEKTGRKCYGLELDAGYCDVIVKRWCEFTGNDSVKVNGKKVKYEK